MDEIFLSVTTFWYFSLIVVASLYMMRTRIKKFAGWFWIISNFVYLIPASYIYYTVYADVIGFGILAGLCCVGQGAGATAYTGFFAITDVVNASPPEGEG